MRVSIIAVGRLKERFWREACDEYLKRLSGYADLRVIEVADRDGDRLGVERALSEEAADIARAIPEGAYVIALDIGGQLATSEQFAGRLGDLGLHGTSSVAVVIGGSWGLAPEVLRRSDLRLSLGRMTLPHNMARVVILEQIYRAFRILRNEPYHK